MIGCGWPPAADRGRSAVGQIVLFDLIAVGLEQHGGAAQLADLLLGALDHAVTLAGLLVQHHPGRGHLEALFGAGFSLELGHLALLCGGRHGPAGRICSFERAESPSPRQPFSAGRRKGGVMAEATAKYNHDPGWSAQRVFAAAAPASPRRQHHHNLAAFEARFLLDLGDLGGIVLDAIEELVAQLLVRHLAPAEAQRHLHLVALFEKALHRAHLHIVIVVVDHGPELDLLDLDDLLFLAGFRRLLLRLVFIFAVIENFADGRGRVGGNLDEIKSGLLGLVQSDLDFNGPKVVAGLVDQLDFANTDLLVDARAVLRGGLRGSYWATNGSALLMSLQRSCGRRMTKDQDKPCISQRLSVRFAAEPSSSLPFARARAPARRYRRRGLRPRRSRERTCIRRSGARARPSYGRRYRRGRTPR